jgi:hypothetical protein
MTKGTVVRPHLEAIAPAHAPVAVLVPRHDRELAHLVGAAQLEIESKLESDSSHFSFKRLDPGSVNLGFMGSTCTALPG